MSALARPLSAPTLVRSFQLVGHLAVREFRIRYASAVLGWVWAVAPALTRIVVLGVFFTGLFRQDRPDYVAELTTGVLAWSWFAAGVASAARSAADRRELLAQPGMPRQIAPVVSVLTDAFDYLAALPVLLVVVFVDTGRIPVTAVLMLPLLLLLGCLALGLGMAACAADVRVRDARLAVDLLLSVGIYATPVFYSTDALDPSLRFLVTWNPVGDLIEAQRSVLLAGVVPPLGELAVPAALCLGALAVGWWLYSRAAPTFLDHL